MCAAVLPTLLPTHIGFLVNPSNGDDGLSEQDARLKVRWMDR